MLNLAFMKKLLHGQSNLLTLVFEFYVIGKKSTIS